MKIDTSVGDSLYPHDHAAGYAFTAAMGGMHQYDNARSTVNGTGLYQQDVLDGIAAYFRNEGFFPDNNNFDRHSVMISDGGTTALFRGLVEKILVLSEIALQSHHYMISRYTEKSHYKPAIVVPSPNYGYFMQIIEDHTGFELVNLPRDPQRGWACDWDRFLSTTLPELDKKGYRVCAFYDNTPNNPTGIVRGRSETVELANMLERIKAFYLNQEFDIFFTEQTQKHE